MTPNEFEKATFYAGFIQNQYDYTAKRRSWDLMKREWVYSELKMFAAYEVVCPFRLLDFRAFRTWLFSVSIKEPQIYEGLRGLLESTRESIRLLDSNKEKAGFRKVRISEDLKCRYIIKANEMNFPSDQIQVYGNSEFRNYFELVTLCLSPLIRNKNGQKPKFPTPVVALYYHCKAMDDKFGKRGKGNQREDLEQQLREDDFDNAVDAVLNALRAINRGKAKTIITEKYLEMVISILKKDKDKEAVKWANDLLKDIQK